MKRSPALLLLTCVLSVSGRAPAQVGSSADIELRSLRASGPAGTGRLCPGSRNSVRVEVRVSGAVPASPIPLRLFLVSGGGDPIGLLLAEGSVVVASAAAPTSFTFLNIEVPSRLRGRGARLEVRANAERMIEERDFGNNTRSVWLDNVTDWSCGSAPAPRENGAARRAFSLVTATTSTSPRAAIQQPVRWVRAGPQ